MKRTLWQAGILILTVAVMVGLAGDLNRAYDAKGLDSSQQQSGVKASVAATLPDALSEQVQVLGAQEVRNIQLDAANVQPVSLSAAVQDFKGPLTTENVHAQIKATLDLFVRQRADFTLGDFRPVPILILYGDPRERARMAVGIAVPANVSVKDPLRIERFESNAVRHVFQGPHEQLGAVYRAIGESWRRNTTAARSNQREGWPVVLQILDDPTRFNRQQIRTVINVPVK